MLQFKLGDRVIVKKNGIPELGTFINLFKERAHPDSNNECYGVQCDNFSSERHSCNGHGNYGYCWYFSEKNIKLYKKLTPKEIKENTEKAVLKKIKELRDRFNKANNIKEPINANF